MYLIKLLSAEMDMHMRTRRGLQIFLISSYRLLKSSLCVLGTEQGSSEKATIAFANWVISPVSTNWVWRNNVFILFPFSCKQTFTFGFPLLWALDRMFCTVQSRQVSPKKACWDVLRPLTKLNPSSQLIGQGRGCLKCTRVHCCPSPNLPINSYTALY